jgi:FkbM family methyltransferase
MAGDVWVMNWVLSCGIHDRWTELRSFDAAELEAKLVQVGPPRWFGTRPDTIDSTIFAEVNGLDSYRLRERDLRGKAVLDVGGHIGSFAYAVHQRGAAVVHCYEPETSNLELLRANAARMEGVKVFAEAVAGKPGRLRVDSRHVHGKETASYQFAPDDTGDVPATAFSEAVRRLAAVSPTGRVDLLKLDCEGGEWAILAAVDGWELVDAVVGEYHGTEKAALVGYPGRGPADAKASLEARGFAARVEPIDQHGGLFFANRLE